MEELKKRKIYFNTKFLHKSNMLNVVALVTYLFIVISIQIYILCGGQLSPAFLLSQVLVFIVLAAVCPYLLAGAGRFTILVKNDIQYVNDTDSIDKKTIMRWGIGSFAAGFCILYFWYQVYYPGAFSQESIEQYSQVLSGVYTNHKPLLQTWITFTFPLKLTGEVSSVVLFQIMEYAAVIAYMSCVLFQYGGKLISIVAFLFVMLNPATGCMAVCPWEDTTFAICAVLLMTLGVQIHMTGGKWLSSKQSQTFFILVLLVTTLVRHTGILFTLPYLIVVLIRIGNKKKIGIIILFILGLELIRGCIYPMLLGRAESYEMGSFRIPMSVEELQKTDLVYALDDTTDWGIWPGLAENEFGLELQESDSRDMLVRYTEYTRHSGFKYLFWYVGVINLVVVIVALGKGGVKSLFALPLICYNFGSILLQTGSEYRYFYMSFPVLPVLLFLLFGEKEGDQEREKKPEKAVLDLFGEEKRKCGRISWSYVVAVIYTGILFLLNFIMVFNSNFWSDEGFSIMLSRMSFSDMLSATAADVHPPLYYALLQIICKIMNFQWISYRFLSIIPYGIMLVFAMTVIWKKFGKEAALILVTCSSLLNTAVDYNVQTRMYSWGALFVLMSFYCLSGILEHNRIRDYVGFVMMSLGAAYTHYYCLISVAFFYLVLLLVAAVKRKEYLARVLSSCVVTVVVYLPWFFILLQTFERTTEWYWMTEIPSLKECMLYLFSSSCAKILLTVFVVASVVSVICGMGIMQINKLEKGKVSILLCISDFHMNNDIVWMLAGVLGILGTAVTGIAVSRIFRPMFSVRYVYPVSAVAWLMLGIILSRYRKKTVCVAIIIVLIVRNCLPFCVYNYQRERYCEKKLKVVLDATEEISTEDIILTDVPLMDWTIINTYYPGVMHRAFNSENMSVLQEYDDYWLFLGAEIDDVKQQLLEESGYEVEECINYGNLGRMEVYIYEVKKVING